MATTTHTTTLAASLVAAFRCGDTTPVHTAASTFFGGVAVAERGSFFGTVYTMRDGSEVYVSRADYYGELPAFGTCQCCDARGMVRDALCDACTIEGPARLRD